MFGLIKKLFIKAIGGTRNERIVRGRLKIVTERINPLEERIRATEERDAEARDANLRQIPILLKRTALSAYPRSQVASLSGKDWFHFLNSTVKTPAFTDSAANTLNKISYSSGELSFIDLQATTALLNASRQWLKHHQSAPRPKDSGET